MLGACAVLIVIVFFKYRNAGWPLDRQGIECLGAFTAVLILGLVGARAARGGKVAAGALAAGLVLGGLWTIEIAINNVLHPVLPLRDYLDDAFWAAVVAGTLAGSALAAWRSPHWRGACAWGSWAGLASGAVACLTALLFTVFGMRFITGDPVSAQEWAAQGPGSGYSSISAYWAYQTLAGAILHLLILGLLSGVLLGALGGAVRVVRTRPRDDRA
jgi:hypothetical protein